jgi:hypothetical protein
MPGLFSFERLKNLRKHGCGRQDAGGNTDKKYEIVAMKKCGVGHSK